MRVRSHRPSALLLGFIVSAVAGAGCDKPPHSPTTPTTGGGAARTVTDLRIDGPATIAPDTTEQFTTVATFSDGSSEDFTLKSGWSVFGAPLATIVSSGQVRAGSIEGATRIRVTSGSRIAKKDIVVLTPGTFVVRGTVGETVTVKIYGALVEVLSGTGAGKQARSSYDGSYALYGLSGAVDLRVTAPNYKLQERAIVVGSDTTSNFSLELTETPPDISGDWTMSLSTSASCRASLPDYARDGEFDVSVAQSGSQVHCVVKKPSVRDFCSDSAAGTFDVWGSIFGRTLGLNIWGDTEYGTWSFPCFAESLAPSGARGIVGIFTGTAGTPDTITGTMAGDVDYWPGNLPSGSPTGACRTNDHAVVLRRK